MRIWTFRAKSQKVKKFTFRAKSQKVYFSRKKSKSHFSRKKSKSQKVYFSRKKSKSQKVYFSRKKSKSHFSRKKFKRSKVTFRAKSRKVKKFTFRAKSQKVFFRAKSQKVTFCRKKAKHTFTEKNSESEKLRLAKKGYKLKSTKLPYRAKGQKVLEKNTIKEQKNVSPIAENIKISFFQETPLKSRNVVIGPAESHNSVVKKQIIKLFCLPCFGQKSKNQFSPRTVEKPRFKKKMTKSQTVTLREVDSIDCFSRNKGHKGTVAAKYQKTTWRKLKHA